MSIVLESWEQSRLSGWVLPMATPAFDRLRRQTVAYPACVNTCIANVNAVAFTFGCVAGDTLCLCRDANFGYAIRDCTAAICSATDAEQGTEYVISTCAGAAAVASNGGSSVSAVTVTASSILSGTSFVMDSSEPRSSTSPTTYTTFTTTGVIFTSVSNELRVSTYTYTNTVTDFSIFTWLQQENPSTSSNDSTVSPASTSAPNSAVTTDSGGNSSSGGGLTTGAKIGIGVGVSLGALFMLGIAAMLFWRSRRRRHQREAQSVESNAYGRKAELHNEGLPRTHGRSELNEKQAPVELDATTQRGAYPELTGDIMPIAELRTNVTNADTATQSSALAKETSERHTLS